MADESPEWTRAPFTLTRQMESEWAFQSILPDNGGEMGGTIVAASEDEAKAKLAEIYPGITFA